jgi:ornithine cyclodeaminase/alanine dehydrogenase-like protein (mu-crystallin family)
LSANGIDAEAADDPETEVGRAECASCATLLRIPLVLGKWMKPDCHLDLVGAFTPEMREAYDDAIARLQSLSIHVSAPPMRPENRAGNRQRHYSDRRHPG